MKNDLVHQTAMFLEVPVLVVFAVANKYAGKSASRVEATNACDCWRRTGFYSQVVEDFCLDTLTRKIGLNLTFSKHHFQWSLERVKEKGV